MNQKWWTLIAVAVGVFMLLVDVTIVNVALPDIERALHASLSDLQWVIDAYALTLAALQLTAGSLADRFGRKRLFAIGLGVFTVGCLHRQGARHRLRVLRRDHGCRRRGRTGAGRRADQRPVVELDLLRQHP